MPLLVIRIVGQVVFVERSFGHSPDRYVEARYRLAMQK